MKFLTIIALTFLTTMLSYSQVVDTTFYNNNKVVSADSNYDCYKVLEQYDSLTYTVKEYFKGGSLKAVVGYKTKHQINLKMKDFNPLSDDLGMFHGACLTYQNDTSVDEVKYEMGKIVYGTVRYYKGDTIYGADDLDKNAIFPGGYNEFNKYLAKNLKYPQLAKDSGLHGKVYVWFYVDKFGVLKNIKILRGIDPLLDNEAIRVIKKSPSWEPAIKNGKPVAVSFSVPIVF